MLQPPNRSIQSLLALTWERLLPNSGDKQVVLGVGFRSQPPKPRDTPRAAICQMPRLPPLKGATVLDPPTVLARKHG